MMTEEEILDGVEKRKPWFHCVQLPHGIVTPGTREPDAWNTYKLPERLDGKTVLDIGAWEGQFSFEAERRGAKCVMAIDVWNKTDEPGSIGAGLDNFLFCHKTLASEVVYATMNVYDLPSLFAFDPFDYVFFLEVLYHLQDPLLGLRKVASVCKELLVLETWIDALWIDEPAMIFYPGKELAGDPTNWWGPNIKCVQLMCATVGFKTCELVWSRNDVHLGGRGKRACFHARK